jgi:hypothetical protein
MLSRSVIRKEHKKAVAEMAALVQAAIEKGLQFPEGNDYALYLRLDVIKNVLEWVHSDLVTTNPNGRGRIEQLLGDCYYYGMGPVDTEMVKRRF